MRHKDSKFPIVGGKVCCSCEPSNQMLSVPLLTELTLLNKFVIVTTIVVNCTKKLVRFRKFAGIFSTFQRNDRYEVFGSNSIT